MSLYPSKPELLQNLFRYSLIAHGYRGAMVIDIPRLQRDWRNYPIIVEMLKELPQEPTSDANKVDVVIKWIMDTIRTLSY